MPLYVFADWAYLWVSVFVLPHPRMMGQRICSSPRTHAGSAYLFYHLNFLLTCNFSIFLQFFFLEGNGKEKVGLMPTNPPWIGKKLRKDLVFFYKFIFFTIKFTY